MFKPSRSHTAGIIVLTLAVTPATVPVSASARVFNRNSQGSIVFPQQPSNLPTASRHPTTGGGLDWGYVAIGSGAAAFALLGVAGTLSSSRRRPENTAERSTINA